MNFTEVLVENRGVQHGQETDEVTFSNSVNTELERSQRETKLGGDKGGGKPQEEEMVESTGDHWFKGK